MCPLHQGPPQINMQFQWACCARIAEKDYPSCNQAVLPEPISYQNTRALQPAFEILAWPMNNIFLYFWSIPTLHFWPFTQLEITCCDRIGQEFLMEFSSLKLNITLLFPLQTLLMSMPVLRYNILCGFYFFVYFLRIFARGNHFHSLHLSWYPESFFSQQQSCKIDNSEHNHGVLCVITPLIYS